MSPNLERALLLFQQSRHELAENELRQEWAAVGDPYHHAYVEFFSRVRENASARKGMLRIEL